MIEKSLVVSDRLPQPARKLQGLVQQLLKFSQQQAVKLIHDGGVRVNGRVVPRPQTMLEVGDRLEVAYEPEVKPLPAVRGESSAQLEIIFQDDHLVVVNKPPALLTVPTPRREPNTLISLLSKKLVRDRTGEEAFVVHRLDRGVSGLLVFGKRLDVAKALRDQFEQRKPERKYVALVAGDVEQPTGTFRSHLATDKDLNRYSTDDESVGELAITHYQVLQKLQDATLVEVWLETGRRNQIRVHFAEAGYPVLGDERYGRHVATRWPYRRLALHARRLGFNHPVLDVPLVFESPLPWEMQTFR